MFLTPLLLALVQTPFATTNGPAPRACTVYEMNAARIAPEFTGILVTTGTVQSVGEDWYHDCTIADDTGRTIFRLPREFSPPKPGDRIEVVCHRHALPNHDKALMAERLKRIGSGPVPAPKPIALGDLDETEHDLLFIVTEGSVMDIVPDEVDKNYTVLLLKDGDSHLPLFMHTNAVNRAWRGARVRVTAKYSRLANVRRRFSGPFLGATYDNVRVLSPAVRPADAPLINPMDFTTPREIALMDRHSTTGRVLAVWNGNQVMLGAGDIVVNARLYRDAPQPAVGGLIRIAGYPETDLYRLILDKADWEPLPDTGLAQAETPDDVPIDEIIRRNNEKYEYSVDLHGRLIRLSGTVLDLPSEENPNRGILLEIGEHRIPVNCSSCPEAAAGISPGCRISVTGRCLMETAQWRSGDIFPQISGFSIILRSADDLKILRHPPWWTPLRLFVLIILLAVLLVGILVWNRVLKRLVEHRGRQLARADSARIAASLRVEERTRLAVELHDSLSQNLTGVALQIKSGRLPLAEQALRSCREELRNCLWDLRSNAIDCATMDKAIRQTIAPQTEDVSCAIRFNVPRGSLSDNTAYAILRIVRELVANAVRHGRATSVRVAGSLEPDRLLFSVQDNGCGFDPDNRPGIAEGHFGLEGVQERVDTLGGTLTIESSPGKGTRACVILPVIQPKDSETP